MVISVSFNLNLLFKFNNFYIYNCVFIIYIGQYERQDLNPIKSSDPVRIIIISNDCHFNGRLELDNFNAERYYNVSYVHIWIKHKHFI